MEPRKIKSVSFYKERSQYWKTKAKCEEPIYIFTPERNFTAAVQ